MKKKLMKFFVIAISLVLFAGCNDAIKLDSEKPSDSKGQKYGSLTIVNSDRQLVVEDLKYASIVVSGTGINIGEEPTGSANINNGAGVFGVDKIPVGKNRVVTVQALDAESSKLDGVRIRAIVDINEGENTVAVNWNTTALGNVFYDLMNHNVDISAISAADKTAIQNAIDTSKHATLINSSAIAADYAKGVSNLKAKSSYVLKPSSLSFSYSQESSYKVQVSDPSSEVKTCSAGSNTISNIAPGVWKVIITNSSGKVLYTKSLNVFNSGATLDLGSLDPKPLTDIVVHTKPYKYMHYWVTGQEGKSVQLKDEGNGWCGWTFENTSTINLLFSTSNVINGDWSGKTSDMSRTACGEYWYYEGKWYDSNPEDAVKPEIVSFTSDKSGSVSGDVMFTISATDNAGLKSAKICYDTTEITTIDLSGTSATEVIKWNTAKVKNGTYSVKCVVYDGAGNACESQAISFTTSNTNLPPVVTVSGPTKAGKDSEAMYRADAKDQNGGTIASYSWTVSGGTIVGDKTGASIKVKMPSTVGSIVTVTVTVKDEEGASATDDTQTEVSEKTSGDFREETIYFLMTTRFYDGDSTNNQYSWDEGGEYLKKTDGDYAWRGDFAGLIEKLDYIKALGFSAIWITPVVENSSGIDYHGYHASDFSKVDPRYAKTGQDSMQAYQELIDACHAKGIKVIQDIVLNHTGNFGEAGLFKMFDTSKTSITADKRTNFVELDPNGGYGYNALKKALGGKSYDSLKGSVQYDTRINAMKEDSNDTDFIYHHCKTIDWNSENVQLGQMAGDCVDLNTENPKVYNYLIDCYNNYIDMGVDGFRIDTVKHISRLTFNNTFIPAFKERGGDDFFIFGETCARYRGRWNEGVPAISPSFYTWKETESFAWSDTDHKVNSASATSHFTKYRSGFNPPHSGTPNHLLNGNEYHKPDWSKRSGLDQIDFPMHWAFRDAAEAFNTAVNTNDPDFNDATFNVTYVDSHDYAPDNAPEGQRFAGNWPDKLNLLFTFRGIPCIYYGSEIEFKKGKPIDPANDRTSLEESGRAYLGTHLEGNVTATDYGEYTASGTVAQTLNHELAQHIIRLNKIRRAVPALQKGQYSTQGCSGNIAFKRRFVDTTTGEDSFVLVAINGGATFSNVPNGTYVDLVTGDKKSGSTISTGSIGQDNMRVYVLQNQTAKDYGATGKIGKSGTYLK